MVDMAIKDFFPPDFPVKVNRIEVDNGLAKNCVSQLKLAILFLLRSHHSTVESLDNKYEPIKKHILTT